MKQNIDELKSFLPYEAHIQEFDDNSGRAVFAARWFTEEFESFEDFIEFTHKYCSVMQDIIKGMAFEEINKRFVPHERYEQTAKNEIDNMVETNTDISIALKGSGFINIPWLQDYEHTKTYEIAGTPFKDYIGVGPSGFLIVFITEKASSFLVDTKQLNYAIRRLEIISKEAVSPEILCGIGLCKENNNYGCRYETMCNANNYRRR